MNLLRNLLCMSLTVSYKLEEKCRIEDLHGLRKESKLFRTQTNHFVSHINKRIFFARIIVLKMQSKGQCISSFFLSPLLFSS